MAHEGRLRERTVCIGACMLSMLAQAWTCMDMQGKGGEALVAHQGRLRGRMRTHKQSYWHRRTLTYTYVSAHTHTRTHVHTHNTHTQA